MRPTGAIPSGDMPTAASPSGSGTQGRGSLTAGRQPPMMGELFSIRNLMPPASSDRFVRSYLKTRHMVLLVEMGRHGSIMQAAQAAGLTQRAASKLLGELEHALSVALFERLPRGVKPTDYGKVLIRRAGAALAEMDAAHQEVGALLSGMRGRVAVGAILTPAVALLPAAVQLLKARHGGLDVAIEVDSSRVLLDKLRGGQLDIVIGRMAEPALSEELGFAPITDEPHSLVVRAGHPLLAAPAPELVLATLRDYGWILPPEGSIVRERLAALFLAHGLALPDNTVATPALPVVSSLLAAIDMIAPLPLAVVQTQLDVGVLAVLPMTLNLRMDVYGIITRRQHQLTPAAQAMLAAIEEAASAAPLQRRYTNS